MMIEEVRAFLGESLKSSGYGVWEAPSGEAALKILGERRIDLVIGDAAKLEPDGENPFANCAAPNLGLRFWL